MLGRFVPGEPLKCVIFLFALLNATLTAACVESADPEALCVQVPQEADVELWTKVAVDLLPPDSFAEHLLVSTPTLMNADIHIFEPHGADASTMVEFHRRNKEPTEVSGLPDLVDTREVVLLYPGAYPHPFGNDWLYYDDYRATGVLRVTRPAFSCDGRRAFLYIENACGSGCTSAWTYNAAWQETTDAWNLEDGIFQWTYTYENRHQF